MARIPAPLADLTRRRTLLGLAVDIAGSQQAAADLLGVARSAVSQWLTGDREVEWYMVHLALQRALRRHPEEAPRVVQAIAGDLLDLRGVWCPELDPDELGDVSEEGQDVSIAHGATIQAVRARDPNAVDKADQLVREALELRTAVARRGEA